MGPVLPSISINAEAEKNPFAIKRQVTNKSQCTIDLSRTKALITTYFFCSLRPWRVIAGLSGRFTCSARHSCCMSDATAIPWLLWRALDFGETTFLQRKPPLECAVGLEAFPTCCRRWSHVHAGSQRSIRACSGRTRSISNSSSYPQKAKVGYTPRRKTRDPQLRKLRSTTVSRMRC
ncbi:hypothetical protein BDW74DRAFT_34326 [Aspergillus multicolor]|uniref:uncharacterized protein n=1 Tax=Aspergillus multicolor TaxID=41759 RepID=UPI003CCD0166